MLTVVKPTPLDATSELHPGDRMEDGTIFVGISPDTHKPFYASPADAPLTMKWKQAMDYSAPNKRHRHTQAAFRVPTTGELHLIFQNRAKIGGFNETGKAPAGWYWSSTEVPPGSPDCAWGHCFSDGYRGWVYKHVESSLRLVRD